MSGSQATVAQAGESGPPYLSTVADAILMLDYSPNAPQLERTIRVLKMRGSAHCTEQRRLRIGHGGLSVSPLDARAPTGG